MRISQTSNNFNNLQTQNKNNFMTTQNATFKGALPKVVVVEKVIVVPESAKSKFFEPVKKFFKPFTDSCNKGMDKVTTGIAKGLGHFLGVKPVEKLIDKTKNLDLVSHLQVLTSLVLSGFYMKKTMENQDLEEQRKKTLAINQGGVLVASTILSYTFNGFAGKKVADFTDKFMKANASEDPKLLAKYKVGIKAASSMMIFGIMYRFIAPVAVTPIANHIGNRIQEKKEKKEAERMAKTNDK